MCSIKFDKTGFLSLTEAGLQEIGRCDQVSQILRFICFFFEPTDSLQRWTSTRTARNRLSLRKQLTWRWIPGAGSLSRTSDRGKSLSFNTFMEGGKVLLLLFLWLRNALCHSIYSISILSLWKIIFSCCLTSLITITQFQRKMASIGGVVTKFVEEYSSKTPR